MTIASTGGEPELPDTVVSRLRGHLDRIYGGELAAATLPRLLEILESARRQPGRPALFDESDVILITYGDQVREPDQPPLASLRQFLAAHVSEVVSGVHLLPHYPWTSDDGFAVVDYTAVDPALGTWQHVEDLGREFRLMFDAVVNHTSASSQWFLRWRCGDPAYADHYIAVDSGADLRSVVRPRTSPLLTPFWSSDGGTRSVWTTFSADQVDLNYANPDVLLEITDILLQYVAHGARLLRLDAIAFLWKRLGTSCLHLPETHEIIRLWRTVLDAVAPGTLLVTETNVPHAENITYFGDGTDEAHLVYQFPLPPLTLATFHAGDATKLTEWARALPDPGPQASFLNFLASHDGIGLRPVEGLLSADEIAGLCAAVQARGGMVSYRARADGSASPYELNSVYFDALAPPGVDEPEGRQVDRFLSAHAVLLSLAGVPAIYFHSLFGSRNWPDGAHHTGRARVINRQRFARSVLEAELNDPGTLRHAVLTRLRGQLGARVREPAFHPSAAQLIVDAGPSHFALQRTSEAGDSTVVCVHDVSGRGARIRAKAPDRLPGGARLVDLLDGSEHVTEVDGTVDVAVPPYGARWLRPAR
jgi:glucosylglycerate phosphorylase